MGKLKAAAAGIMLSCVACSAMAASGGWFDDELDLNLRLKNDLRRADKPSAGSAKDIYAWVQGFMAEFDSGWLFDCVGVEGGWFYVAKLAAPEHMSSRWYLDDHASFGYWVGAVKFKVSDVAKLKIGRFITDNAYGSLPYYVPLINANSNRTLPTATQGALLYLHPHKNLDLWAMYREKVFTSTSALQGGFRDEGLYNEASGDYDDQHSRYFFAASVYNDLHRLSAGFSSQHEVGNQYMVTLDNTLLFDGGDKLVSNFRFFGANVYGDARNIYDQKNLSPNTQLYSWQLSYITPDFTLYGSVGYLNHETWGSAVDSDLGFPNSWSMDRNHEDMWSYQIGVIKPLGYGFSVLLAPILTDGYESHAKDVKVQGVGITYGITYDAKGGPLDGLKVRLYGDWCTEKRDGSQYGDRLHFWDVKMTIQYDFNII